MRPWIWVGTTEPLALPRQCELTKINQSTVYATHLAAKPDVQELSLLALIDVEYTRHPLYGSRKMKVHLCIMGYKVNRNRVQRMMGTLGSSPGIVRGGIPMNIAWQARGVEMK